ncbi:MAG: hypothetical protein KBC11_03300 [Candidatus Pacebacteria bacterium]|jgi:hypothetical protein|nr:hypothetical protein [Candidatus Paceibacterota bacterium]
MESQDNIQSLKPSKKFLIRGGIATGILVLILVVQTSWFSSLFSGKSSKSLSVSDATVGEIVGKDSNGNGIADWEERLWGLDPTVSTTNGVSNKSIIEAKRRTLQNNGETGPLNETDILARELFGLTSALGDSSVDKDGLAALAIKLGEDGSKANTLPIYSIKDIKTVQTNRNNLISYEKNLSTILSSYDTNLAEIDIFINSIETENYSNLEDFDNTVKFYNSLSTKIVKISVPVGIAQYHLDIANSIAGIGKSFEKMKLLEDNGVMALVGLSEYRYHDQKLSASLEKLATYLNQYGIIQ